MDWQFTICTFYTVSLLGSENLYIKLHDSSIADGNCGLQRFIICENAITYTASREYFWVNFVSQKAYSGPFKVGLCWDEWSYSDIHQMHYLFQQQDYNMWYFSCINATCLNTFSVASEIKGINRMFMTNCCTNSL